MLLSCLVNCKANFKFCLFIPLYPRALKTLHEWKNRPFAPIPAPLPEILDKASIFGLLGRPNQLRKA